MKKTALILGIAFLCGTLSSCYRHTVCATYLDAKEEVQKIQKEDINQENL